MRTHHTHLSEAELTLLEEQFRLSPYGQQQQQQQNSDDGNSYNKPPTKLSIFDFDSTLFLSPLLSGTLWDAWLVNAITTENLLGAGFWRDIRSLPPQNDDSDAYSSDTAWHGWWNEDVVMEARRAIEDPETLTVLLTGRRAHPFGHRIKHMLSTKNLAFDILGLRPDPFLPATKTSAYGDTDESLDNNDGLNFNEIPDTFSTTMDFKSSFILHLKTMLPSLQQIVVWDDRPSQIPVLQEFVATLIDQDYFEQGSVESVMAVRPKYNPRWEFSLVETMVSSHNRALKKACTSKAPPETVVVDELGTTLGSYDPVQLVRRPFTIPIPSYGSTSNFSKDDYSVLRLTPSSVDELRVAFETMYQQHVKVMEQSQPSWQFRYGEQPVFFGDIAFGCTSTSKSPPSAIQRLKEKNIGADQHVTLVVTGWDLQSSMVSEGTLKEVPVVDRGLTLRVRVLELEESNDTLTLASGSSSSSFILDNELLLPLWYKPSTFQTLSNLPHHWTDASGSYDDLQLKASLDHVYLYGLDKL
ncbi:hypothetical protein BCR42DRAFT_416197 [Absidia repens]|uniref:Swiss Army Knife RNA repair protein HAD domain-containing protein n=1 Tax=Absidia repens TaxID=90262 RepID=A0A1X2IGI7_9FUNG|nr:hypothetical protein BCR42DRAFT_416197 [Absidia repens]